MAGKLTDNLRHALEKRKTENAYRSLNTNHAHVDFLSNDYLGLAQSDTILKNIAEQPKAIGATGSRLLSGNNELYDATEKKIAGFHNTEAALIFNSGYHANTGLLSCLLTKDDTIFYDQYIHASLRQGIRLSHAKAYGFRHNDLQSLQQKFRFASGNSVIVVESIYSMDGDEAPLQELAQFCRENDCCLIVDEAHATGIIGENGEGKVQAEGLENEVFARIHTFGKALGSQGAAITGSATLKEYLVNFAKPFIYTTALPPLILACINKVYDIFPQMQDERKQVLAFSQYLEPRLKAMDLEVISGNGPIKSVIVPGNDAVKALANTCQNAGYDLRPILAPTVPKGRERLRICLHAYNTWEEVEGLLAVIKDHFGNEIHRNKLK